jgi:hypothetical protein
VSPRAIEVLASADIRPGMVLRAEEVQSQSGMTLRAMVVEIWSLHPDNGTYWAKADCDGRQVVAVKARGLRRVTPAQRDAFYGLPR